MRRGEEFENYHHDNQLLILQMLFEESDFLCLEQLYAHFIFQATDPLVDAKVCMGLHLFTTLKDKAVKIK